MGDVCRSVLQHLTSGWYTHVLFRSLHRVKPFWYCRLLLPPSCRTGITGRFPSVRVEERCLIVTGFCLQPQGMAFTNTSPLVVPTRAKQVTSKLVPGLACRECI